MSKKPRPLRGTRFLAGGPMDSTSREIQFDMLAGAFGTIAGSPAFEIACGIGQNQPVIGGLAS